MSYQERVPQKIFELSLNASNEKLHALAHSLLISLQFNPQAITQEGLQDSFLLKVFSEDKLPLERARKFLAGLRIPGLRLSLRAMKPSDWLTLWKRDWKPARLTQKLDVVPVWYKDKYKARKGRDYILMDTLLSFGTGLHETTQIISQYIEDKRGQFNSFLDIGTGTGILALVALKHGARDVYAIDIGELSVQAARDNMKANQLYFTVKKADIMKFRHAKTYNFVAANLITHDLIDNAPNLLRFVKKGGWLAISGISLDNLARLKRVFAKLPLRCLSLEKGERWAGLLYQRD